MQFAALQMLAVHEVVLPTIDTATTFLGVKLDISRVIVHCYRGQVMYLLLEGALVAWIIWAIVRLNLLLLEYGIVLIYVQ